MTPPSPAEIRETRRAAKLTQTEAAAVVHVRMNTWQKWEAGDRQMPAASWELFLLKIKK